MQNNSLKDSSETGTSQTHKRTIPAITPSSTTTQITTLTTTTTTAGTYSITPTPIKAFSLPTLPSPLPTQTITKTNPFSLKFKDYPFKYSPNHKRQLIKSMPYSSHELKKSSKRINKLSSSYFALNPSSKNVSLNTS